MSDHYILIGQTPVPVEPCDPYTPEGIEGLTRWAFDFEASDRRVAESRLWFGLVRVSTVFLGIDHNYQRSIYGIPGPPILFESMSFYAGQSADMERCSTWPEAEEQHRAMVRRCRSPRCLAAALAAKLYAFFREMPFSRVRRKTAIERAFAAAASRLKR